MAFSSPSKGKEIVKASPRGGNKKGKDWSPEHLEASLNEVEKSWRAEQKARAQEEKQHKKNADQAKKMIAKEIRSAAGAVRKKEMDAKRVESRIGHVDRQKEQVSSTKSRTSERFDQKLSKCENQRNDFESTHASKMGELGEAKGRLAHAKFAEAMLAKGLIVPIDGPRGVQAREIMDGEIADMVGDDEYARLANENAQLATRLEMAENYIKQMGGNINSAQGSSTVTPMMNGENQVSIVGPSRKAKVLGVGDSSMVPLNQYPTGPIMDVGAAYPVMGGNPNSMVLSSAGIPTSMVLQNGGFPRSGSIPRSANPPVLASFSPPQSPSQFQSQRVQSPLRNQSMELFGMGGMINSSQGLLGAPLGAPNGVVRMQSAPFETPGGFKGAFSTPSTTAPMSFAGGYGAGMPSFNSSFVASPNTMMGSVPPSAYGSAPTSVSVMPNSGLVSPRATMPPGAFAGYQSGGAFAPTGGFVGGGFASGAAVFPQSSPTIVMEPLGSYAQQSGIGLSEAVASYPQAQSGRNAAIGRGSVTSMLFDQLDVNHDGVINKEEFRAGLQSHAIRGGNY